MCQANKIFGNSETRSREEKRPFLIPLLDICAMNVFNLSISSYSGVSVLSATVFGIFKDMAQEIRSASDHPFFRHDDALVIAHRGAVACALRF